MLIQNLENKNQFLLKTNNFNIFQSYDSIIAVYDKKSKLLYLNEDYWDYSKTTLKHLYIFIKRYTYIKLEAMLFKYKNNKRKSIQYYIKNDDNDIITLNNETISQFI